MILNCINEKFEKFSQTNNVKPEINEHVLSNGKKTYSLVIRDFLKYPEEFTDLLYSFPHFKNEKEWCARPGSSFSFPDNWKPKCTHFIRNILFDVFKVDLTPLDLYTNCFSSVMNTHFVPPHTDYDFFAKNTHLACNLGLTKCPENILNGTSFWTFKGKQGVLEMSMQELNDYHNHMNDSWTNIHEWDNIDQNYDWNLEYIVPMEYNSIVVYSTTLFHIPYFDKKYFSNVDRFSLASMYNVKIEQVNDIPNDMKNNAFDVWNKFEICKIFNYYF